MNFFINKKQQTSTRGYALIELLFYIAIFSAISLVTINALFMMARAFNETKITKELSSGTDIVERISRDIRNASSIVSISATSLKLNTLDSGGGTITAEFTLSGADVRLLENDTFIGNLNSPNVTVSDILFTEITTTSGKAIKVYLSLGSTSDSLLHRTVEFYNTVVLRGGY